MSTSSTLVDRRPISETRQHDDHAGARAESSATPLSRPEGAPASSRRARSSGTALFGVAVVAVVAAFVASIVFLVGYEPGGAEVTSMSWPAAVAGMIGLFSAVAGLALAFIASVRSDSS